MLKFASLLKVRRSHLLVNIAPMSSQRLLTTGTNSPVGGFLSAG